MNKSVYCPHCRDDKEVIIEKNVRQGKALDETYLYQGVDLICKDCGSKLYDPAVFDYNLEILYDLYRNSHGLFAIDDLRYLMSVYDLSFRNLADIVSMDIDRVKGLYEGDVPNQEESSVIQELVNDPEVLREKVEESLISVFNPDDYIRIINNLDGKSPDKLTVVEDYILSNYPGINQLQLHKLLYYIEGFFYALYGKYLFVENCQDWVNGPVYRPVWNEFRMNIYSPIRKSMFVETESLTKPEREVIDSVIEMMKSIDFNTLVEFTHKEDPWLLTRGNLPERQKDATPIPKVYLGTYFKDVCEELNIQTPNDIHKYLNYIQGA